MLHAEKILDRMARSRATERGREPAAKSSEISSGVARVAKVGGFQHRRGATFFECGGDELSERKNLFDDPPLKITLGSDRLLLYAKKCGNARQ